MEDGSAQNARTTISKEEINVIDAKKTKMVKTIWVNQNICLKQK